MAQQPFSQPVLLALDRAGPFREALEYLDRHWPAARTARALIMCRAAINSIVSSEAARLAVLDAAERARATGWPGSPEIGPVKAKRRVASAG